VEEGADKPWPLAAATTAVNLVDLGGEEAPSMSLDLEGLKISKLEKWGIQIWQRECH
jgi:hypothetical protein